MCLGELLNFEIFKTKGGMYSMENLTLLSSAHLKELKNIYLQEYELIKHQNFSLDISRGKPSKEQLDLSTPLLNALANRSNFSSKNCSDYRNYGNMDGLLELKKFMSELTGISEENFIVGGNSSLSMMFDVISCYMIHGVLGNIPWSKQEKIKFLCPSPGYDRHFAMCEYFGMELIPVKMTSQGPDMDFIENIVSSDDSVKGIWCVPKYSNPQGITYSNQTVTRFAKLKPKAKDFRIFWDNAYFVHDLTETETPLLNLMEECKKYHTEELPIVFFSTSKITLAGAGVAFLACGKENLKQLKRNYSFKTVGFDKVNQMRHLEFLKDKFNLKLHMKKQRSIIKPKFDLILEYLEREFSNNPILSWTTPKGGYFISVDTMPGCARRTVQLCKECGLTLTPAGSTFPYGKDPQDSNIRIAPTFPSLNELRAAMKIFCLAVKLAYVESKI